MLHIVCVLQDKSTTLDGRLLSCRQRSALGQCDKKWMLWGNFCAKTCGRCSDAAPPMSQGNIFLSIPSPQAGVSMSLARSERADDDGDSSPEPSNPPPGNNGGNNGGGKGNGGGNGIGNEGRGNDK